MNEIETGKKIEQRIRILTGHSNALMVMLEEERNYKEVFLQVQALKGSIKGVEDLLIEKYIDESLTEVPAKTQDKVGYLLKLLNKD